MISRLLHRTPSRSIGAFVSILGEMILDAEAYPPISKTAAILPMAMDPFDKQHHLSNQTIFEFSIT
jgi:hypothetical protein